MRNLFLFFREHYFYFLFLLLETISLVLLFNYNEFQKSSLYSVSNAVSGSVNSMFNGISEYFSLGKTNRVLIEEMAKLHSRIPEAFYVTDVNIFYKKDSIVHLEYKYISLYLAGELGYDDMFRLLNTAIHQFAKRQMTWFRRMERQGMKIHWIEGEMPSADKVIRIREILEQNGHWHFPCQ